MAWRHLAVVFVCTLVAVGNAFVNLNTLMQSYSSSPMVANLAKDPWIKSMANYWTGGAIGNGKNIRPIAFKMPRAPTLAGPLAVNNKLQTAEQLHARKLFGPASFAQSGENLYVGTYDGKIYNVASCEPELIIDMKPAGCRTRPQCGQPTSMRIDPTTGDLLVLDSYRGLYRINLVTRQATLEFSAKTPVNGRPPVHLNDFVVTSGGQVILSDSSDSHNVDQFIYVGMEGRRDGRLIVFYPATKQTSILPVPLAFPNGVELENATSLLVAESSYARIVRISLNPPYQMTPMTFNLPGLPDNIRASDHGTFWVGCHFPRHNLARNVMDQHSRNPNARSMAAGMMNAKQLLSQIPRWGITVELDQNGNILRSLQDPKGKLVRSVTEVSDYHGIINVGSIHTSWIPRIMESQFPTTADGYLQVAKSRCMMPADEASFKQQVRDAYARMG